MFDGTQPHPPDGPPEEPLVAPAQSVLPLDLDPDEPVPYRLTPRARRVVAPESVPELQVVPAVGPSREAEVPADLDDPHDPRSARARALRRGGMSVPRIAHRLGVDELVVRTWTDGLSGGGARRSRLRAVPGGTSTQPSPDQEARLEQRRRAFDTARTAAARDAAAHLSEPAFVRGLSLVVATAEVDPHAVMVLLRDVDVARAVRTWLVDHAGADPADLRAVLRLGSRTGADLAVHRWAAALDVPVERLSRTHWRAAPSDDASEARLRVADTNVAARVAGWRDALFEGVEPATGHEVGF